MQRGTHFKQIRQYLVVMVSSCCSYGEFVVEIFIDSPCFCYLGSGRLEEKELEPWDPSSSGVVNGEDAFELDGNANGWDVNDMFHKNETVYGVQSTFDQSLAGYTIQIQKKDTQDFK